MPETIKLSNTLPNPVPSANTGVSSESDQLAMLKNILNGLEALIAVCEFDSFKILFLNDSIRKNFAIAGDGVGHLCYELLQNRKEPCQHCPYRQLQEDPDKILTWEHRESIKGNVLRKTARAIDWLGGKKAHLEYAVDITGLKDIQEQLKQVMGEIEYQNRLLHTVNRVSAILLQSSSDTIEQDLLHSMGIIAEAAGADRVYIWENYQINGKLYCRQTYEWSEVAEPRQSEEFTRQISYRNDIPSWENAFLERKCINGPIRDLPPDAHDLLVQQGIISLLVVPIYLKERFWGFVGFDDCHDERVFSEKEEEILRSVSELIANALIRDTMEKSIHKLKVEVDKIFYDPLTNIYNRRYFEKNMPRLIRSLSRSDGLMSFIMVDIDHFKCLNDTYGHIEGDNCLKIIAEILRDTLLREDDFVARYGGEEFAIILPGTNERGARLVAQKLLENVRTREMYLEKNGEKICVALTISLGVTTGKASHTHNISDYVKRADELLYESKKNGRDQYTFASL